MTEERLQEIKDSIDIQKEFMDMKNYATELVEEEQELYDEVINLQQENERLKKELNKHIKEGIEKDQEIERLTQGVTLLTNELIDMTKEKEKYKSRNDKAIKCIKSKFVEQGGFTSYEWNDLLRDLLYILQGSDKNE